MSLKTILCHVALDDRLDARLDIACEPRPCPTMPIWRGCT